MNSDQTPPPTVAYLAHDVNDAAISRRVVMLQEENVVVKLVGFHRHGVAGGRALPPGTVDLGRTLDSRLIQRAIAVLRLLMSPGTIRGVTAGATVLMARNIEMLVLGWRVKLSGQRLVYECLDIHRLMLGSGWKSRAMRWIERRLLAGTDLVIISSPAFARNYFASRQGRSDGVLLVENKVAASLPATLDVGTRPLPANPRVIGWFGMLRCRRTLDDLAAIARNSQGQIEVVIAGIASAAEFPDFILQVQACPGLRYLGSYRLEDLPELYAQVDFVWAIDYFEEGLNSDWLLPNRLYEGLANRTVPIALRHVETGRWLARHGVGLLVDDPVADLPALIRETTSEAYAERLAAVARLPTAALYQTPDERRAIIAAIMGTADA